MIVQVRHTTRNHDGAMSGLIKTGDRPVQVVHCDFATNALKIHTPELRVVLGQDDVRTTPVVLLSIAGAYRTGKSFLFNFLLRYLYAKENKTEDFWLKEKDDILTGFSWRGGSERTTVGMQLWSKPFFTHIEGKKVAIILMDTQGMGDESTDPKQMGVMLTLSTLLSSVQVFNVTHTIGETDLKYLELLVACGRLVLDTSQETEGEKPFRRFVYLVRDWIDENHFTYGSEGGYQYLQSKLEIKDSQPESLKNVRANILGIFEDFQCFLMPHPGLRAAINDDVNEPFRGKLSELRKRFVRSLEELADFLFSSHGMIVKQSGGSDITGEALLSLFERYTRPFQSGVLPGPEQTREVLLTEYNRRRADTLVGEFEKEIIYYQSSKTQSPSRREVEEFFSSAIYAINKKFEAQIKENIHENASIKEHFRAQILERERKSKDTFSRIRLEEQEIHIKLCKEAVIQAKDIYECAMKPVKRDVRDISVNTLMSEHHKNKKLALDDFLVKTNHCQSLQTEFLDGLLEFLDKEFNIIHLFVTGVAESTAEELKYCHYMSAEAKEKYRDTMDKKYDYNDTPTDEDALGEHHKLSIDDARQHFEDNTRSISGVNRAMLKDIHDGVLKYCDKKKIIYEERNKRNADIYEEMTQLKKQLAFSEAQDVYRKLMRKSCGLGEQHLNPAEFRHVHIEASKKAEKFLEGQNFTFNSLEKDIPECTELLALDLRFFTELNNRNSSELKKVDKKQIEDLLHEVEKDRCIIC